MAERVGGEGGQARGDALLEIPGEFLEGLGLHLPDPFEAYSGDYTVGEPIPMEMLKTLNQTRKLIFGEAEKAAQAHVKWSPGARLAQTIAAS